MSKRKTFFRYCLLCEGKFQPSGKFQKFCDGCILAKQQKRKKEKKEEEEKKKNSLKEEEEKKKNPLKEEEENLLKYYKFTKKCSVCGKLFGYDTVTGTGKKCILCLREEKKKYG